MVLVIIFNDDYNYFKNKLKMIKKCILNKLETIDLWLCNYFLVIIIVVVNKIRNDKIIVLYLFTATTYNRCKTNYYNNQNIVAK